MIRTVKPPTAPRILMTRGVEQTEKDRAAYDANPDDYRSGTQTFHAANGIYGAKSVKNALLRAQHNKCCYCESTFRPTYYGDVEHYRPKGAVKQAPGWDKEYPGYYWLAYDWDNLFVSCKVCNTSHKGILFPLVDNNARARSYHDDIGNEQPLFINPAIDDPRNHIRFRAEVPVPHNESECGLATIEGLGLRRPALDEDRRERLDFLKALLVIVELGKESTDLNVQTAVKKAQERLDAATHPEAKFSSMAQDFLGVGA